PSLKSDVLQFLTVQNAVETRTSEMGAAPKSVRSAISALNKDLAGMLQEISRIRDGYSGMISQ
ncbi:MAG: argininosuccinate lyase, partial [Actinobacteria bacterium]|nr:argininosuccinate lyase [Actinomycetota bacterium]